MRFINPRANAALLPETPPAYSPRPFRAPELVWRKEIEAAAAAQAHERQLASATVPASASRAASNHPAYNAVTPFPAAGQRLLDPLLMDRVAEDVIGRIERRVRIERERRGL